MDYMEQSPSSTRVSDAAASEASSGGPPFTADPSNRTSLDYSNSSPSPSRLVESPTQQSLRSEEYRQLFRLPLEEVLIQDFNCALQENFLLQGHMYLFVHYVCFYSNLFGFETKKIIPFHEVTSVRRANSAAIFPTAIEIIAGEKKFFFTSFLSRDEAFKLVSEGWLQHGNMAREITDNQSELNGQENGIVVVEKTNSSNHPIDELDLIERKKDVSISEDSRVTANGEAEIVSTSFGVQDNIEEDAEVVASTECSSSGKTLVWEPEECDAPKVPGCYTMAAESKFPIKVEEFFDLFFSDDAVDFVGLYHRTCGDKEFRCTSWCPHEKFGHTRNVSFQHPIKLYFGAKFGSCQEVQKFRVYRNSRMVIETSQEINDVPYGDYFSVEGLWDVERDDDESKSCCIVRVYINVAFSKKTMFKGKIVQSTLEECRETYAIWIDLAHELLKQKKLEKETGDKLAANMIPNGHLERQTKAGECFERSHEASDLRMSQMLPDFNDVNQQVRDPLQGSLNTTSPVASFGESAMKFGSSLKSQVHVPLFLVITLALVLLLMQISILVLLSKPQQIHVIPQADCTSRMYGSGEGWRGTEMMALLEKQINHLKDEMFMVERLLNKMQRNHALLKVQLEDLELLRKQQS